MAVRVYNAVEVSADLYARQPIDNELEFLMGASAIGDSIWTIWQYDTASTSSDNWTGNVTTSSVIKPTAAGSTGRWHKRFSATVVPAPVTPTINANVARALSNAAGSTNQFTISTTQNARVYYSLNVVWNITALLSTASTILLEYSTNGGSSWNIANQVSKNINLGLIQSGSDDLNVSGEIPANALVRIRPSVSTNSTISYVRGQEVLY